MQEKAKIYLLVPNLTTKLSTWFRDFSFEAETPHLSTLLLAHEKSLSTPSSDLETSFFTLLDANVEELPAAYYRSQIHTKNTEENSMCADPIHLEVGMNDVTLTNKITDLTDTEAQELIEILNTHFKDDGLQFIFGSNQCWYVRFDKDEAIRSHHLESMLMQNAIGKQAHSEHRNWQVIQNETQMLLHSSEINQQREMAGLETINSLWFWGAGKPINTTLNIHSVYTSQDSLSSIRNQTLAKAANCDLSVIPNDMNQILESVETHASNSVLVLDQLIQPSQEDNIEAFQQQLTNIDSDIIQPLLKAWKDNKIDIEINTCDGTLFKPKRPPSYKFWLKPKKLRELLNEARS